MAFNLPPQWVTQLFDNFGALLSGGSITTYLVGTTTPKATYTDATGAVPNANPVVLDSAGRAVLFLADDALYTFVLKDADGVTVGTFNGVGMIGTDNAPGEWIANSGALAGVLVGNGTGPVTATPQPAGLLVGTTAAQTLTNKTLTAPAIAAPVVTGGTFDAPVLASPLLTTPRVRQAVKADASTFYTLVDSDEGKRVECDNTGPISVVIPPNSALNLPIGWQCDVMQISTGQVTIQPGVGVAVNGTPGLKLRARWSAVTLVQRAVDNWVVVGDLAA